MTYHIIKNKKTPVMPVQITEYCITDKVGRVLMHVSDNLDNPKAFATQVIKALNNAEKTKKADKKALKV